MTGDVCNSSEYDHFALKGNPGAVPGLPVGGVNPPGAQTHDFVKFSQKLHEIENILGHNGGVPGPPFNPPLEHSQFCHMNT